jgi:hypothetical protein
MSSLTFRLTGLLKRPEETRARFAAERPFVPTAGIVLTTVLQPVAWIRDQLGKPSCVGQAVMGRRDALVGGPPWGSAVDLWTDARRRDGTLAHADYGTWAESAFESLIRRGTSRYKDGEDSRPIAEDTRIDDLSGELEAADTKIPETWEHHQIVGAVAPQATDALDRDLLVVFGTGCRDPFFSLGRDEVVTTKHLGGNSNGHEQGIVGFHLGRGLYIGQGSWGEGFAGITLPSDDIDSEDLVTLFPCAQGRFLPGCFWMEPEVLEAAWDIDVLRVK